MLDASTRREIVTGATYEAVFVAGRDFLAGKRSESVTQADIAIVSDLGRRLGVRDRTVRACPPTLCELAAGLYALAFQAAYREHMADLTAGKSRDLEHLSYDVLRALEHVAHGGGRE